MPGSSVRGIFQARILEWVAIPYSRGSSQTRDRIWISCIAGRFFIVWATWEAPITNYICLKMWLMKAWGENSLRWEFTGNLILTVFWVNSIKTSILSRVKQITSPGWMHETSARVWCTGKTQRDEVGWEVGCGRWGSGWGTHVNPWLIHVNVWQKSLQYCKVINLQLIKINGKKKEIGESTLKKKLIVKAKVSVG